MTADVFRKVETEREAEADTHMEVGSKTGSLIETESERGSLTESERGSLTESERGSLTGTESDVESEIEMEAREESKAETHLSSSSNVRDRLGPRRNLPISIYIRVQGMYAGITYVC